MLPHSQHRPTHPAKLSSLALITPSIGFDLFEPPRAIVLWGREVPRTTVPRIAVNEDNELPSGKHDVRPAGKIGRVRLHLELSPSQLGDKRNLSTSSGAPLPTQTATCLGISWCRHLLRDLLKLLQSYVGFSRLLLPQSPRCIAPGSEQNLPENESSPSY